MSAYRNKIIRLQWQAIICSYLHFCISSFYHGEFYWPQWSHNGWSLNQPLRAKRFNPVASFPEQICWQSKEYPDPVLQSNYRALTRFRKQYQPVHCEMKGIAFNLKTSKVLIDKSQQQRNLNKELPGRTRTDASFINSAAKSMSFSMPSKSIVLISTYNQIGSFITCLAT